MTRDAMTTDELFADRYRLERRLGMGGMSTVELAFDTRLERYVAVKLLAEHLAEDSAFVSRFRREALAAARLVHPNVVQVFDFGLDHKTGRQYIVMEHVDGQSCAELLRDRGFLAPDEAVGILTQACRGLDYAHRNGVVHRDVKPGNLLRNRDDVIKLADFGIAKAAEHSDITKVGSVIGTAAYLSPEQARGESAGPSSDLYALGVVAYQLLAGRLPYDAASLTDLARQQEAGPPEPLHELNAQVPHALSLAVMRALGPVPESRYPSAVEFEQALRDGLHGVAPAHTAATAALAGRETATHVLAGDRTGATALKRRPLEPLPQQAAPRRPTGRPPELAPVRRRRRGRGLRRFFAFVLLLAAVGAGIGAYQALDDQGQRGIQLKENVRGNLQDSVDELKDLIRDNTR